VKITATLKVSELFFSIQGESSYAGQPCVFIRLAGCNLRCTYCDAGYTYEEPGHSMGTAEILGFVAGYPVFPVEVTGGEPLIQEEVYELLDGLLVAGRQVLLETNGSLPLDRVPAGVVKIIDIKCPDSGMAAQCDLDNLLLLCPEDELKFVLSSRADYDWTKDFLREHRLGHPRIIHFSAVSEHLAPGLLADWILTDRLPVRLQLQLHKVLWPATSRGK
jgi:7-carboxy-7-deazaguanine synthase